jgi:signal peptidase
MVPTYQPGDLLVVKPYKDNNTDPAAGDAATYQVRPDENIYITHRITEKAWSSDGSVYTFRGDANNADDDPIVADQIMGKVIYSVPKVGYVQDFLGQWALHIRMLAVVGLTAYILSLLVPDRLSNRFGKAKDALASDTDDDLSREASQSAK